MFCSLQIIAAPYGGFPPRQALHEGASTVRSLVRISEDPPPAAAL